MDCISSHTSPLLASITAGPEVWSILFQLVVLLAAALCMGVLFERLKQSAILGYLLAGTLVGPGGLNIIQAQSGVPIVAELGVSLLLFAIGLKFSVKRLLQLGPIAGGGGSLQVFATLALATVAALACGLGTPAALAVGATVALSSTACVLRILTDRAEIDSIHGRSTLGILLLQDLAVVPLVLFVTMLGGAGSLAEMIFGFAKTSGLIIAMAAVFYLISNKILPHMLGFLSLSRNRELLILLAVVLAMGSASAAHALKISPALGAFIAGILLAESPFATQIRSDISVLRILFITLFFASVGMLGDLTWIVENIGTVALTVSALIIGKAAIATVVTRCFGRTLRDSVATGASLAQVGEFGVVIAGIARGTGLIDDTLFQLLISSTLLTLFLTPFLIKDASRLGKMAEHFFKSSKNKDLEKDGEQAAKQRSNHVLLIGFGPAGQRVGKELLRQNVPALVFDLRPQNIELAESMGLDAALADSTSLEILIHHGITRARAIVITLPDHRTSVEIVRAVQTLAPDVLIIVRARYHTFVSELKQAGAHTIVDEENQVGHSMAAALRSIVVKENDTRKKLPSMEKSDPQKSFDS